MRRGKSKGEEREGRVCVGYWREEKRGKRDRVGKKEGKIRGEWREGNGLRLQGYNGVTILIMYFRTP